jgi:hypothetical protein
MTSTQPDAAARAASYAREVDRELSDLPPDQRERLLADLASHLSETTDGGQALVDQLGTPSQYADELRATGDLAPPASPTRPGRKPARKRTAIGACVILALLLVGVGMWLHGRESGPTPGPGPSSHTTTVTVPTLSGLTESAAARELQRAGLILGSVDRVPSRTIPQGIVVTSNPQSGSELPARSTVNLDISSGP